MGNKGRPQKEPAQKRSERRSASFTKSEAMELDGRAKAMGMTRSDFIRVCCLERRLPSPAPMPPVFNRKIAVALGRASHDFSALVEQARRGDVLLWTATEDDVLNRLRIQVEIIYKELIDDRR